MKLLFVPIIIIALVLTIVIGINATGNVVLTSSNNWLGTTEGISKFTDGTATIPLEVLVNNTTDILFWIVPVENQDGLYLGYLITEQREFEKPLQASVYIEPKGAIFSLSQDDAYSLFIEEHPEYSAGQITRPRLIQDRGLYWLSEVENIELRVRTHI